MPFTLRKARRSDFSFIWHLREQSMKALLARTHGWNESQQKRYAREALNGEIVLVGGKPVGAIALTTRGSQLHLTWMAILPEHQRRGLGAALLRHAQDAARRLRKPLTLQVLRRNAAVGLYRRLGFNTYDQKGPDTLLMRWDAAANATMPHKDPRIDAYIDKSADFAKPILSRLRRVVHAACPDVQETMKWSFPHFMYKGMLCSMASFKRHCAFGFWKSSLVLGRGRDADAMGQFGRITKMSDLPPDRELAGYVRTAMLVNETGVRVAMRKRAAPKRLTVPRDLARTLATNRSAKSVFDAFTPGKKREYVEWIVEAKSEDTRKRRIETAVAWMAEGKPRRHSLRNDTIGSIRAARRAGT